MSKRLVRRAQGLVVVAALGAGLGLTAHWVARAQQAANDDPRFTGTSTALDTEGYRFSRRHFAAGARSAWHRHTHGQLLFVEAGRARTQQRGGALRELHAGDTDYSGPNVDHWHGAAPDEDFTQIAISFGEGTEWLELVSDAEYAGR